MRSALALLIMTAAAGMAVLPAAAADAAKPDAVKPAPEPADCLITRSISQTQIGSDNHYYVRTARRQWWRNTMECPGLGPRRAVVHTSPIGRQCRGDIVQIVDFSLGGINFGGCGLGSWEPVSGPPKDAPNK